MGLGRDAWTVAPTACLLLATGAPTVAWAAEGTASSGRASSPELVLQEQMTFTGEVRDILLVGDEVWAATGGGLAIHRRSDGAHLRTLTSRDGLPGNSLRSLALIDASHVGVGSDFAAAIIGLENGRVTGVTKLGCEDGCTRFDPVYAMAQDRDGQAGVALLRHQGGLERWRRVGDRWQRVSPADRRAGMWRALAFSPTPVLGGLDGALTFFGTPGKPATTFALGAPILALRSQSDSVLVASGEKLWQARATGVSSLVEQGDNRSPAASALSVPAADGTVLVGTARGELYRLNRGALSPIAKELPGRVTAVLGDGDRVWLGLGRAGLHAWSPGKSAGALRPNEICDNHVVAVTAFAGRTVAATFDRGACYRDASGWHAIAGLPSAMVHGMGSDGRDLYLATSNGLARLDRDFRPRGWERGEPAVLRWVGQSAITAIGQLDATSLALVSPYGLLEVHREANRENGREGSRLTARFTHHRNGVPLKMVAVAAADGDLWMASETQGVTSLASPGRPSRHLQDPEDLPENWVTAVAAVARDDVWVGTCQRGVVHVRGDRRQLFDRRNQLRDDMVVALAADARGAFVGTLAGLAYLSADGGAGRRFSWETGIPDPRSSALWLAGDQLWLGTESGLALYEVR